MKNCMQEHEEFEGIVWTMLDIFWDLNMLAHCAIGAI